MLDCISMKQNRTRNLKQTRQLILNTAFGEVFRRGFQGVSIDEIVAKTDLTKGALYHQFPSKLDLGYALVEEVIQPMIIDRWIRPLDTYDNPLDGILIQLQKLIGQAKPAELKLGCPLNNLTQEMSTVDRGFKLRLQKALKLWISEMDLQLQRAKENGHLQKNIKTLEAAYFIVMAHEGFYGIIKGADDPQAFAALFVSLEKHFDAILRS